MLMTSARDSSNELIPWLLDRGADVTLTDEQGYTALHYAARRGTSVPNARLPLESGAGFDAHAKRRHNGSMRRTESVTSASVQRLRGQCLL